jgi:signal transduction histidine kinase
MQESLMDAFKVTLPVGIVFVLAGTILMAQRALRPIAKMTSAAERISAEHPSERLPVPDTNDEIERLSLVLNQSFDRLENAYSASERFSSAASHQLKTPLTVLRAGLSELRGCDYLQPIERETVESMLQQTRRLTTLCEDLLLLAQADAGRLDLSPEPLDLVPLLRGAVDDMEVLGMDKELTVDHELPLELVAMADTRRISIVLQNLGENAVKYNRINGKIKVTARIEKGKAVVSVASTGPQIPAENSERIFERFNRGNTGENLKGHGLGLSIARSLARAHGGELRLARSDANWTEFELILPLASPTT